MKPAAPVREGDVVEFYSGDRFRRVVVQGLPERTVSRDVARTMYIDESPAAPEKAAQAIETFRDRGAGRPTKKERRDIEKWRS